MSNLATLQNRLREMILTGELAPGERLTEAALADRLGVSRTPIRILLPSLAAEGLLNPVGRRGFAVRSFSKAESLQALQLRGVLEGQAAAWLAMRGAPAAVLDELDQCLAEGDALFAKGHVDREDEGRYGAMNKRFHSAIVDACRSEVLRGLVERLNSVPFIAPSVIVFDRIGLGKAYDLLFRAHGTHHAIVEAIRERDPARAEALFREHANQQRLSMFERRHRQFGAETEPTKKRLRTRTSRSAATT